MNKKYSWWKLLKAQYSWKNDKSSLYMHLLISCIITLFYVFTDSIIYTDTGLPVEFFSYAAMVCWVTMFLFLMTIHHSVKFLFVGILLCGGVTYFANNGDEKEQREAIAKYNDMLTWRK